MKIEVGKRYRNRLTGSVVIVRYENIHGVAFEYSDNRLCTRTISRFETEFVEDHDMKQYEEASKRCDDLKFILLTYSGSLGTLVRSIQLAYKEAKAECIRLEEDQSENQ